MLAGTVRAIQAAAPPLSERPMAKRDRRWPIWRIVLVLVGFVAGAAAFFVAGRFVAPEDQSADPNLPLGPDQAADYTMSNMLMLFGAICCAMVLLCIGWLVVRHYKSIPAWKKRAKLPAHRRK